MNIELLKERSKQLKREKYIKEYYNKNKTSFLIRNLKHLYGIDISKEDYLYLLSKGCTICGSFDDLCLDHDHKTKKIRKALCRKCNVMLGMARDNITILEKAIQYLKDHA